MNCLIGHTYGTNNETVAQQLEAAYRAIAEAYLASIRPPEAVGDSFGELARVVNTVGALVELDAAHEKCKLVCAGRMDAGEVRNQLRHVEVIIGACELLKQAKLVATRCSPTQGSTDPKGQKVEDLEGDGFVVDVFGGGDIMNNGKAAAILQTLGKLRDADGELRTFIATRRSALMKDEKGEYPGWKAGNKIAVKHPREKYLARAMVKNRVEDEQYVLVEVEAIAVEKKA